MRTIRLCSLGMAALLAIAMLSGEAEAQRRGSARVRVSVTVVAPAVPFATVRSAIGELASDTTTTHTTRWFAAGARLTMSEDPLAETTIALTLAAASVGEGSPTGTPAIQARLVRTITLDYVAN